MIYASCLVCVVALYVFYVRAKEVNSLISARQELEDEIQECQLVSKDYHRLKKQVMDISADLINIKTRMNK